MKKFNKVSLFLFASMAIFFVFGFINNNIALAAKVNINTADVVTLDTIPEVGPATALKIIAYRETNGLFVVIEDIMKVSGIKQATFDKMKDFICVSNEADDGGDENATTTPPIATTTLPIATTTPPIATTTVPIATTTATTTVVITAVYSVHYYQEDLSVYTEPTIFEISAGRERLAYLDLPINFEAKNKKSADLKNNNCLYLWNFGDGISLAGEKVEHTYKYLGDYNVVLNGSCGDTYAVSRTIIKVLKPNLAMSENNDGALQITNLGKYEINLFNWKVQAGDQAFIFPLDTIISAGKTVIFPAEYLKIQTVGQQISLIDNAGQTISQIKSTFLVFDNQLIISQAEIAKFALAYNNSNQVKIPVTYAVNTETTAPSPSLTNEGEGEIPLTASVVSVNFGFWSKLFHPIRTIKETFY